MARISAAANLESRDGTLDKGGLLTNAIVEVGGDRAEVHKRSGMDLLTDLGTGRGQGITSFVTDDGTEILYALQNGTLYVADVPTAAGAWSLVTTTGTSNLMGVMFSFGGLMWTFDFTGTGLPQRVLYASSVTSGWTVSNASWPFGTSNYYVGQCALVLNRALYLLGGNVHNGATVIDDVWKSTDGATFTKIADTAATYGARVFIRGLAYDNKLWYLGGASDTAGTTWDNNIYSSTDGVTWTSVTTTPAFGGAGVLLRKDYGVIVGAGKMWVLGGSVNGVSKNDVWSSTDGVTWTQETASAAWSARGFMQIVYSKGTYTLFGGRNVGGTSFLDVFTSTDLVTWTSAGSITGITFNLTQPSYCGVQNNRIWGFDSFLGVFEYASSTVTSGGSVGSVVAVIDDFADFARDYDGTQIMVRLDTAAYKVNTSLQTLARITDPNYPPVTVRGNPYLNGHFYVMEPDGTIWNSAEDDCTAWAGTDFISAEFEPDGGVALIKYGSYIVAFGRYTTEAFFDAGTETGSPLKPVESMTFTVGCAHGNSVASVESTVIWMGQRKGPGTTFQKGRFVAMLEGQSYKIISTQDVERVLNKDDLSEVHSCVMSVSGHTFYELVLVNTSTTLLYDINSQLWYRWTRATIGSAKSVSTLTQSNGTATATSTAHGFSDGDQVTIAGASPAGYNLTVNITVVNANSFTYPVSSSLSSPATGTITATGYTYGIFDMVASCNYSNEQVFQERNGGGIYKMNETFTDDDGPPIDFHARLSRWDGGNNKSKFISWMELIGDTVSSTALVRYSDDDGQNYSKYRRIDMSLPRKKLTRQGRTHARVYEIRHTLGARLRLTHIEMDAQQGG